MSRKLLIDAAHKEETRVALVDEKNRLMEYDIDSLNKQTVKGNVYLAKVMRVEPSLQAAFVDYGGNRHGFLAFSEIHPDYFRIPVSDRETLAAKLVDTVDTPEETIEEEAVDGKGHEEGNDDDQTVSTIAGESVDHSDEDHSEDARKRRPALHKMYKIQEVVHKNQILLIQVVKEERGQKGAALTTYLSLAGRYCVLMPNSPQAGGISRKISNTKERKTMREALKSLEIPKEMGLIIRTAGQGHTKIEIKRDATYLMRQWGEIRDVTLKSIAPALIYQEDSIIKRVIRDQYSKEISVVLVEGEECYKSAKAFMKKLLPSHAKNVQQYKNDKVPLFIEHKIEQQIEKMHEAQVMLPSGGSIVINPTEALVSIDINSGKATRERHIEETALNTNLEAAVEIARQVRLRDLAGLVVIDFIDMDDRRHVHQVERKVREAFKNDRARVQMGKISPFGLLELSRQRLRPSMLETSSQPCPHCHATGHIRSIESMALLILRTLEEEGIANRSLKLKAMMPLDVAFYILNEKREHLADVEARHEMSIVVEGDHGLIAPHFKMIQLDRRPGAQDNEPAEKRSDKRENTRGSRQEQKPRQEQKLRRPQKPQSDPNDRSNTDLKDSKDKKEPRDNKRRDNRNRNRPQKEVKGDDDNRGNILPTQQEDADGNTKEDTKKEASGNTRRRPQNRRRNNRKPPEGNDNAKSTSQSTVNPSAKSEGQTVEENSDKNTERKTNSRRSPRRRSSGKASEGGNVANADQKSDAAPVLPKTVAISEHAPKKEAPQKTVAKESAQEPAAPKADKPKAPRRRSWLKKLLD